MPRVLGDESEHEVQWFPKFYVANSHTHSDMYMCRVPVDVIETMVHWYD